jgi:tetratricopeptide (TPR) repeat protein
MKKTTKAAAKPRVTAKPKTAKAAPVKVRSRKPEPPPSPAEPNHLKLFEAAVKTFRTGAFHEAKLLFDQLLDAPSREIAHAARLHSRMCEQRLSKSVGVPNTAEDLYNYGIALVNQRDLDGAQHQLEAALKMSPNADHVAYALALCVGLKGDLPACCRHLSRAIELQPRNRSLARNDPDFADLVRRPPLNALLSRPSH